MPLNWPVRLVRTIFVLGLCLSFAAFELTREARAQTGASEVRINFEDLGQNAAPPQFGFALTGGGGPPRWIIVQDRTAPAGPNVLAELTADKTSYRFPLAILGGFAAEDVELTVAFKPVAGSVDQAAGLVARLRDENNYYIARANALENNVRLYRIVNGKRQKFAGVDLKVPSATWQTLGLRVQGEQITVSLDGKDLFAATDRTFTGPGRVGLWTKADSVTYFDDFVAKQIR